MLHDNFNLSHLLLPSFVKTKVDDDEAKGIVKRKVDDDDEVKVLLPKIKSTWNVVFTANNYLQS